MAGAYETGVYRNIFKECGYSEEEIEKRVKKHLKQSFMEVKKSVSIMKQVRTWDTWRTPEIMMSERRACHME